MLSTARVMTMLTLLTLVLFGVLGLVGSTLPRRHHSETSAIIHQSPSKIWTMLSDLPSRPHWRENIVSVRRLPDHDGHPQWLTITDGGDYHIEVTDAEPPTRLTLATADSTKGFGSQWTFVLTPEGTGTRVRIREQGYVDHPVFRFFFQVVYGFTQQQERFLQDLGHVFGENVQPQKA